MFLYPVTVLYIQQLCVCKTTIRLPTFQPSAVIKSLTPSGNYVPLALIGGGLTLHFAHRIHLWVLL